MTPLRIPFDQSWKEIVTNLIHPFVEFFLPDLYLEIEMDIAPEFLEKELFNDINRDKSKGILDKLVKFRLKSGIVQWIYIHIEFQTNGQSDTATRMYSYYQLIREHYGQEIVAIAIYTGRKVPKNPDSYSRSYFGTTIIYHFNSYIIKDQDEKELLSHKNPFSLVVLANLYVLRSYHDYERRYKWKEYLVELAENNGYSRDYYSKLLIFVSEIMKLPSKMERRFEKEVLHLKSFEKRNNMKAGPSTRRLINSMAKEVFGDTVEDLIREKKQERKNAEQERKNAEQERKNAEQERRKHEKLEAEFHKSLTASIVLLYTEFNLTTTEIHQKLKIDHQLVIEILKEKGLMEK